MPEEMERKIKAKLKKKNWSKKRKDAYLYGALRSTGWKPKRER